VPQNPQATNADMPVHSVTDCPPDHPRLGNSDTCVVMPMFNEAQVVGDVVTQLKRVFSRVVCIDDGSTDDSASQASACGAQVVRHPVNLGQGAALQTGFEFALHSADVQYVLTFDADGQHQVGDALRMVQEMRARNVDVLLGSRFLTERPPMPRSKRMVLRAAVVFTRLTTGLPLTDAHNGLRVFNRHATQMMDVRLHGMAHASEILNLIARSSLTYLEVPVSVLYTDYSRSKGQPSVNAINIAFDVLLDRARVAR